MNMQQPNDNHSNSNVWSWLLAWLCCVIISIIAGGFENKLFVWHIPTRNSRRCNMVKACVLCCFSQAHFHFQIPCSRAFTQLDSAVTLLATPRCCCCCCWLVMIPEIIRVNKHGKECGAGHTTCVERHPRRACVVWALNLCVPRIYEFQVCAQPAVTFIKHVTSLKRSRMLSVRAIWLICVEWVMNESMVAFLDFKAFFEFSVLYTYARNTIPWN